MAQKALASVIGPVDGVDTEKKYALGTRISDGKKAYVYCQGVSSGAAGKWVTFTTAGVTTLTVANANGMVGILMGTLDATTDYGFVQVFGDNVIADVTAATVGEALYLTATPGRLDVTDVAADMVHNVDVTVTGASNVAGVFLNYPRVIDVAID
jgi:hypothetical protein